MHFSTNVYSVVSRGFAWPSFLRLDTCKVSSFLPNRIFPLAQAATIGIATRASGIRLPQGGWCSSLTPALQIALVASLLNIPANKRNDVLLQLDFLMEGFEWTKEVPGLIHALAAGKEGRRCSFSSAQQIAILASLLKISDNTMNDVRIATRACEITPKGGWCDSLIPEQQLILIAALLKFPVQERDDVLALIEALIEEHEWTEEFPHVILALRATKADSIRLPRGGWCCSLTSAQQIALVAPLLNIPVHLRNVVLALIDALMKGRKWTEEIPKIIHAFVAIRAGSFKLPKKGWCSCLTPAQQLVLIASLLEIPDKKRYDVLVSIGALMKDPSGGDFAVLIKELNAIDLSERDDVVEKTKNFLKGAKCKAADVCFLLKKLASVPRSERKQFPLQVAIEEGRYSLAKHLSTNPESVLFPDPLKMEEWLTPPCLPIEGVIAILPLMKHESKSLEEFLDLYALHPDQQKLLEAVFERIAERHPLFVRGAEERPELVAFAKKVLENWILKLILERDFKLNQGLPLRVEILEKIVEIFTQLKEPKAKVRFRLALQTHENFEEIVQVAEDDVGFVEELPSQEEFFKKDLSVQIAFMRRAQVFRDREAFPMAFEVIQRAVSGRMNEDLLQQSIHLLRKTEIANSAALKNLMTMMQSERFPPGIRQCACHAVAKVESNPTRSKRKGQLFEILKKERNPQIQTALVECLSVYEYTNKGKDQEITKYLCSLARETNHDDLKRALAFALTLMPDQEALKQALAIVKSPVWDVFDQGREHQDRIPKTGNIELFTYRPGFHDNRRMMRKAIVERLVTMQRESKKTEIERWLLEYRKEPTHFPNMEKLEEALYGIKPSTRYIPFGIFLPENRVLLRGLSDREGPELLEHARRDFFLGAGPVNLWLLDRPNQATWAKVGQVFSSTEVSFAVDPLFSKNGFLFAINPRSFNQALLQHGRLEKDGGLHAISYKRIGHGSIASMFVPQGPWQARIEAKDLSQIQAERLKRKSGTKQSLSKRIVYFDPEKALSIEMTRLMQQQGLKAMTMRDIVEENLTRQALREMLAEDPEVDEKLRGCIKECGYLDAGPTQRVFGPMNQPPNLITVNPRPASPIEVTVPIAVIPKDMTLEPENFAQIFALINQYTVNTPYPHRNDSEVIAGQIVHRKNHNGTHSAKQARFLEALFSLMEKAGSSSLTQEERMHLFLAAYVLRTGRVDESDFSHRHPDDFYIRSALIYEAYAKQFSNNEDLIGWVKKLIFNSVKPEGVRETDIDRNPKNRLGYELLSTAHELDLIRCFGESKIETETKPSLRERLEALLPNATNDEREAYLKQLMEFAKRLCEATGCKRAYDSAPGDDVLFARCSTDGGFCWKQLQSVKMQKKS